MVRAELVSVGRRVRKVAGTGHLLSVEGEPRDIRIHTDI